MGTRRNMIVVGMLVLVGVEGAYLLLTRQGAVGIKALGAYAEEIVARCATDDYRPSCYDKEIPKLMARISMEEAFGVTSIVQEKDPEYRYCHVLGHELSAREIQKDPSQWTKVLTRCPSGVCSNGCLHGGLQERFRAESLTDAEVEAIKPDLLTLCEKRDGWTPTGLERASCYHAMGHLTMYLTAADIRKSIELCDELTARPGPGITQLCYDGAFMQIFQPLEPEDFALIKGKEVLKEQHAGFCNQFSGSQLGSCWSEGWPLLREELQKPEGLVAHCSGLREPRERNRCYNALFYVLTSQFNFKESKIVPYCKGLPEDLSGQCFANAASRLIETDYRNIDQAVSLCEQGAARDKENKCYRELLQYSTYNFHAGSEAFFKLCERLPEPWRKECLKRGNAPS